MTRSDRAVQADSPRLARLAATAVGLAALGVYLLTLYPGLGGGGDAVKFQYIGSVLGTPHPPGYPLYVLVSYLFAHVPIGSLAYRANLLSAVCGTGAAILVCLTLLRLRCHPIVAMSAALALAFDRLLWGRSVGAEVYALNAALVALVLWLAMRWSESCRDRDLFLTVGAFALSLGNHLTVVAIAPAIALFVVLTRRRSLTARNVIVSVLIVALGVAQYGLIILLTYQRPAYVEASARNLGELIDVMRASRFADQLFAFSLHDLLFQRVPQFWSLLLAELNPAGLLLLVLGIVVGLMHRPKVVVLLAASAAGIVLLTINVGADVEGFLVAASVPVWALAGVGLQAAWSLARAARVQAAAALMTAIAAALPAWQISRNYTANDHHRRTYETRYFRALFAMLEPRASIVSEAYPIDQLVLYKLIGERVAGDRAIALIPPDRDKIARQVADGYVVYAFSTGKRELEARGFEFEPVTLRDGDGTPKALAIDMAPLPLFRVIRASRCENIGNLGWRDITAVASAGRLQVRIDNYRPFDASLVMYSAAGPGGGAPDMVIAQGAVRPTLTSMSFVTGRPADARRLRDALGRDAMTPSAVLADAPVVHRSELRVNDRGEFSIAMLSWRTPPGTIWARALVDLNNPRRAIVCGWARREFFTTSLTEAVVLGDDAEGLIGQGWLAAEPFEDRQMRRTFGREAEILVPLARTGRVRIRLHARALGSVEAHPVALSINGRLLVPQRMAHTWTTFEWEVPAEYWMTGLNRLTLVGSDPGSDVAIAVSDLRFELLG